jgi:MFS family permease
LLPVYNKAQIILRALERAPWSRAWWSSVVIFLIHGLVVATWVSRIPAVQASLRLSNGALGMALLGTAVGSVLAIPFCGWLVTRFGSKPVTWWSTWGFCFSPIAIALATDFASLTAALFLYGALAGTMDVSMNVQAVEVERVLGKPTMSRFHAMFSIGGMAGGALGGGLAARNVSPLRHFAGTGVAFFLLASCFVGGMMASPPALGEHRVPFRRMPAALIAVSGIAFCLLVSEGAMADWTAVYLRQAMRAGQGTAAAGYAVFSAAMAVFRLQGDAITTALGRARTVRAGSSLAACGVLMAIVAPSTAWAIPGFAMAGAGCSVVVPLAFGAGGRVKGVAPGAGVATVTGLGYIGFLVGPPAIGFTAQALNLRFGLGIVVVMCATAAFLGGFVD